MICGIFDCCFGLGFCGLGELVNDVLLLVELGFFELGCGYFEFLGSIFFLLFMFRR